ncbi:MAG: Proteasome subunit beta [Promethearchaeota archaeon]|nr:MAG: Proteasome subunit beta [Candidatus Lokiarchaeota archaeon]
MKNEEIIKNQRSKFTIEPQFQKQNNFKTNVNSFKTGTTTVGLTCKDAVILATDKRASMAYFVASKTAKKLHKIQDHLWMTIAGSVADAQRLIDLLRAQTSLFQYESEKKILVKSAAKILSNILYRNKLFPYEVGLILGGVTEEEGPKLIDIGAYGSLLPEKYCAVGSGQNFSYGVLEAKYKENLSIEEGKKIIIAAVRSSIIRDIASGNGIEYVVIKKEGAAEKEFISINK